MTIGEGDNRMAADKHLANAAEIDEAAELIKMAGNPIRLKTMYLLDRFEELSVSDLGEVLDVPKSALSQHLARLRAHRLVQPRRDAQTVYYRLRRHDFIDTLREGFFRIWRRG